MLQEPPPLAEAREIPGITELHIRGEQEAAEQVAGNLLSSIRAAVKTNLVAYLAGQNGKVSEILGPRAPRNATEVGLFVDAAIREYQAAMQNLLQLELAAAAQGGRIGFSPQNVQKLTDDIVRGWGFSPESEN